MSQNESIDQVVGKPQVVTIDGEQYEVSPLDMDDFAEIAAKIRQSWIDAVEAAEINALEKRHTRALVTSRPVTAEVIEGELSNPAMMPLVVFLSLKKKNKITYKQVREGMKDMEQAFDIISAISMPAEQEGRPENPTTANSTGDTPTES